ncbi:fatty-acyl CoA reductase 4, partial [Danaus plexippus plexippus]
LYWLDKFMKFLLLSLFAYFMYNSVAKKIMV